jgi:hypothetical protein
MVMVSVVPSFLKGPKSSALKTGDRVASTILCAIKFSSPKMKLTSTTSFVSSSLPNCTAMSDRGTSILDNDLVRVTCGFL